MDLREELLIGRPLEEGQETLLAVLLTREYVGRLLDERLFKQEGITDQQYNVLRILKGGPEGGHLIRDIRRRMVSRSADVPRLVDRMMASGLVQRNEDPLDRRGCRVRLTPQGGALEERVAARQALLSEELRTLLEPGERCSLVATLERLRDGIRRLLGEGA